MHCSMTFCFFFDDLTKLNLIQVNIEGAGLHKNKQGGGIKKPYCNFPILKATVRIVLSYYKSVKETRRKK